MSFSRPRTTLSAAIAYLTDRQHPTGSWTDFWLPIGTSDAWVTAYVGLALAEAARVPWLDVASRDRLYTAMTLAAKWLLTQAHPVGGWGYNAKVPPDADSTAHVVSFLARAQLPVPKSAIAFLQSHFVPHQGYRTYCKADPTHQWIEPCVDVTAAVLRALYDVNEINQAELQTMWLALLSTKQTKYGWWEGYWWNTANYTTALVMELWSKANLSQTDTLIVPLSPDLTLPTECAFDLANAVQVASLLNHQSRSHLIRQLLLEQQHDGSWASANILKVPHSHLSITAHRVQDARRLFVTATAVKTIALHGTSSQDIQMPVSVPTRSTIGEACDRLIYDSAVALGFSAQHSTEIRDMFKALTHESLAAPCPFPSEQLSSLAGGVPLEFSATVGASVQPALRYAVEVGNPLFAPYQRAKSAIADLKRMAIQLNYDWMRVNRAIDTLVSPKLTTPDGLQFWVWGGIDTALVAPQAKLCPGLKIYVNLLHLEVGGSETRLTSALQAAGIPISASLLSLLETLNQVGFPHEIGFGLGVNGKIACKIYYELLGWRRLLVTQILQDLNFPAHPDTLCPEIPGILKASFAAKRRSGIAFRLDPENGAVRELTIATAFPPPMIAHTETIDRVTSWIEQHHWNSKNYHTMIETLLPRWTSRSGCFHSLFTQTISATNASHATIYLRPSLLPRVENS